MSLVWDETKFKGTTLLILLCLADHANDEGICWPSYERMAKRARCNERHARRCVQNLKAEGWIEVVGSKPTDRGQWVNMYRLNLTGERGGKMSPLLERGGKKYKGGLILHKGGATCTEKGGPAGPPNHKIESSLELSPWGAFPNQGKPTFDEAHAYLMAARSDMDALDACICCERWVAGLAGNFEGWQESLAAFAQGFRP